MKSLIYIGIFYLSILDFHSQSNWRKAIPISIDGGLQFAKISKDSLSTWNNNLVKSIHLQSGISALYKKRVGVLFQGGLILHNENFFAGKNVYSIETLMLSLNCTPYLLFPFKKNEATNLHVGLGLGYSFNNSDMLIKQTIDFKAVSSSIKITAPIIAPEIGITRIEDKLAVSLMATYFYQNGVNAVSTTSITDNNGKYTSTIKGDYLGFKLRLEFKIGKEKVYPEIYKVTPPENDVYVKRTNSVIRDFKTRRDHIVLEFFESNKVDHDSISVCVNGKYILVNHGLTNEKVSIRVPLEKGINTITVYALNEGDIPPNTATCLIHFGKRKEEFPVQTGHKKNASIEIERK